MCDNPNEVELTITRGPSVEEVCSFFTTIIRLPKGSVEPRLTFFVCGQSRRMEQQVVLCEIHTISSVENADAGDGYRDGILVKGFVYIEEVEYLLEAVADYYFKNDPEDGHGTLKLRFTSWVTS